MTYLPLVPVNPFLRHITSREVEVKMSSHVSPQAVATQGVSAQDKDAISMKDYAHYIRLTSTPSAAGKKCVNIKGRLTWESTGFEEKSNPNIINIVISKTLKSCPEYVSKVVGSLHEALEAVASPPYDDIVDTVWVMGGETVYKNALQSPQCRRVYLTQIDAQFPCDCFFPTFEDKFTEISVSDVDSGLQEDNGIQYRFKVYEPKTA